MVGPRTRGLENARFIPLRAQRLCPSRHNRQLSSMHVGEGTVLAKVCRPSSTARHITLIDPAKQSPDVAAQRAMVAVECGSKMVLSEALPTHPTK